MRLPQSALPARLLPRAGAAADLRQVNEKYPRHRRQRPDPGSSRAGTRGADHAERRAHPDRPERRRHVHALLPRPGGRRGRQGRARPPLLDPPRLGRLRERRLQRAQAHNDRADGHGANSSSTSSSPIAAGRSARTARRSPTKCPEHMGGHAGWGGASASSSTTRGRGVARTFGGDAESRARRASSARSSRFSAASPPSTTTARQSTSGPSTRGPGLVLVLEVGQCTQFAGIEGRQEDNVHFCGEHTSIDFQGYEAAPSERADAAWRSGRPALNRELKAGGQACPEPPAPAIGLLCVVEDSTAVGWPMRSKEHPLIAVLGARRHHRLRGDSFPRGVAPPGRALRRPARGGQATRSRRRVGGDDGAPEPAVVCVNCADYRLNLTAMRACLASSTHYVDLGGLSTTSRGGSSPSTSRSAPRG